MLGPADAADGSKDCQQLVFQEGSAVRASLGDGDGMVDGTAVDRADGVADGPALGKIDGDADGRSEGAALEDDDKDGVIVGSLLVNSDGMEATH